MNEERKGFIASYGFNSTISGGYNLSIEVVLYDKAIRWFTSSNATKICLMVENKIIAGYINSSDYGLITIDINDSDEIKIFDTVKESGDVYIFSIYEIQKFEKTLSQLQNIL